MAAPTQAHAFILAGGRGTRFWPLSRHRHPKQLLDFTGEGSLLALTSRRLTPLVPPARQWVITSEDLADEVRRALPELPSEQILAEPVGRNTAPAVALAAAVLEERVGDLPFAILPSDHLIHPTEAFQATLGRALELAAGRDLLLTFGIRPTRAETGYGYIECGEPLPEDPAARSVAAFREKPDADTARRYLGSGRHLWNSGMFAWRASVVRRGLQRHLPAAMEAMQAVAAAGAPGTPAFSRALEEGYRALPSISIDYALLERAEGVAVIDADFQWNDVGHWLAMRELWPHDGDGNAARGGLVALDSRDNVVFGPDRLTALVGVEDLIVVHTEDATLVCRADRAQEIRELQQRLRELGREEYL